MKVYHWFAGDIRFAARSLRRTPVLSAVAILSIALGIAATASVFSVVDAALFRPPPLPAASRLAMLFMTASDRGAPPERFRWSWPRSRLLHDRVRSFESIASFSPSVLAITGDDAEPANAEMISGDYWRVLRISPVLGRAFSATEDREDHDNAIVIISHALWERRFGSTPNVIGRVLPVNGVKLTIVGVAPSGFSGLSGRAQLWIPATMAPHVTYPGYLTTNQNFISVVGRLNDGISIEQARAELDALGTAIARELPGEHQKEATHYSATAMSLSEARVDPTTKRPLFLLLGGAACLLLLACANVAGLLMGRAVSRRREIAIRVAAGASRGRIVGQLLAEAAVVALCGGLLGVLTTAPLAASLALPPALSRGSNFYGSLGEFATPHVDARVVLFAALLCALATFAFGLAPALRASRVDLTHDLKDGTAGGGLHGGRHGGVRQWIVGVEAALAVALLFSGWTMVTAWRRMDDTPLGFDRTHLLTFSIRPSEARYPAEKAPALIDRVLGAVAAVPGVEAVSVDGCVPVVSGGCANSTLHIVGRPPVSPDEAPPILRHYVGPDHFRVLGVPIKRGRAFDARDRAGANHVAIINELAARRFWPNEDPIGKRVWFGGGSTFDRPDSSAEIVGIVGDVAHQALDTRPFQPDFYTPYAQFTYASRSVLVRTRADPNALAPAIRRAVRSADPDLALFEVGDLESRLHASWGRMGYQIRLIGTFAIVALLLAGAGIFAVIAHVVSERRREIGVRSALGASSAKILVAVGRHGARPALIGLLVGIVVAFGAGRMIASVVFGVRPVEVLLVAEVAAAMAFVVLVATLIAARRALAIPPSEAMRAS